MERIAPSVRLEAQIEELLGDELAANGEKLAELGRLGARLVLQRAVEDEVTAFLGRARYERTPEAAGSRNGTRPNGSRRPRARSAWPCLSSEALPRSSSAACFPTVGRSFVRGHWKR